MSKREETRAKIIEAAEQLFHRYGLEKTSMDDIAKGAQKAKGALYYYFESKEDLFRVVVSEELDVIKSKLELVVEDSNISDFEKLKQYLIQRMQLIKDSLNYSQIIKTDMQSRLDNEKKVSLLDDIKSDFDKWELAQVKKIVKGCIKSFNMPQIMAIVDITAATDMIVMIIKSVEIQFVLCDKYKDYSATFNFLAEIIISNLQNLATYNPIGNK